MSTLATEDPNLPAPEGASHTTAPEVHPSHETHASPEFHPSLESHAKNERMRHIPSLGWIAEKLDVDIRRRVEKLWLPYSDLPASDPRHPALEAEFRALLRALDRVAAIARHHRGNPHPPNDLATRVTWTINQTVGALHAADSDTFGKRFPFQTFERSNSEPLWAAMLTVLDHVHRLVPLVREIEPDIDERLYEGLVQLVEPLRREPIA